MKIALISPYSDIATLSVRYLSAYLKKQGFDTSLFFMAHATSEYDLTPDFARFYPDETLERLAGLLSDADLIGLSLMTNYFPLARSLTRFLKERVRAPVLWGGVHPTVAPEASLEYADFVCIGEGEEALADLGDALKAGKDTTRIPNIWSRAGDRIHKNDPRPLIEDLDSLPFPDYECDAHYAYDEQSEALVQLTDANMEKFLTRSSAVLGRSRLFYQTVASRGCPMKCTYCIWSTQSKLYPGQKILRQRDLEKVVEEVAFIKAKYPFINSLVFSDDTFMAYKKDELARFNAIYKDKVGLPFQILASPWNINRDKVALLVDAGMKNIQIGIESGSEKILKSYNRAYPVEKILKMARMLRDFVPDIEPPIYDFVLDNPYETCDDLRQTIDLILSIPRPFFLQKFSLTFFPGTAIREQAIRDGFLVDDESQTYGKHYNFRKPNYLTVVLFLTTTRVPKGLIRLLNSRPMMRLFTWKGFDALFLLIDRVYRFFRLGLFRLRRALHQKPI
jgi:radical SAM superfamily enzyme YgiQ (UPF0313 family)